MKSKLSKFAIGASIMLAITFTLSCSSGDDDKDGSTSSSSGGSISSPSNGGGGGSSSSGGGGSGSCQTGISDTFVDIRDNKSYKTVKICDQTWFAENLNYDVPNNDTDVLCKDNNRCIPDEFYDWVADGRYYDWITAMDIDDTKYYKELWSGSYVKHQGICPDGWHIPNVDEYRALITAVGSPAGTKLKATSGWRDYKGANGNGTDDFGFTALPTTQNGDYDSDGWWLADEDTSNYDPSKIGPRALYFRIYNGGGDIIKYDASGKNKFRSIRCVKD